MKKIVFSLAIIALVAGTISASVNDGGKGKKKKSCCQSGSGCGSHDKTAEPATK
ncbi:MAG: hypothetical protein ACTHJT_04480 [Cytophaga sp.]|uniref:hypothetical protein n=1 Tax=Cytophaga sp. TaxID=29535 RepID=UPI003F7FC0B2